MDDNLIAGKQQEGGANRRSKIQVVMPWLNAGLGVAIIAWGIWYISQEMTWGELGRAFALAKPAYIALALIVILLTLAAKAWRWQLLFYPRVDELSLSAAFWAMMLGQFVNTAVSFLRLGEVARIYAVHQQTRVGKMRTLGTLVLEKTLDLILLVFTLLLLLPVVVVPDFMAKQGFFTGGAALMILIALYLLAYQTALVVRWLRWFSRYLPAALAQRLLRWAVAGLEGLAALRSRRVTLALFGLSALIALLSILTPWALFPAFNLEYGITEAALIHVVLIVAATLPVPTPAMLGVVEAAVIFMLSQFGLVDEAVAFAYAIVYHLIVDLPKFIFGAIAVPRTRWRWQRTAANPVE